MLVCHGKQGLKGKPTTPEAVVLKNLSHLAILLLIPFWFSGMIRISAIAGGSEGPDKPTTTIPLGRILSSQDKGGLSVLKPQTKPSDFIFDTLKQIAQKKQAIIQAKIDADNKAKADALAAEQETQTPTGITSNTVIPPVYTTPATPVQSDDYYVNWIIQHESSGDPYAVNASSGACGLFQRLPCTVTLGDTAGQMADGLAYIASRYGSAYNAYLYWQAHGNY